MGLSVPVRRLVIKRCGIGQIFVLLPLRSCLKGLLLCIPISVLKTSVVMGSDLKLGPTVAVTVLLLYKYVFDTYNCTFAGCGWCVCNAGCISSRHQCCLNLTW